MKEDARLVDVCSLLSVECVFYEAAGKLWKDHLNSKGSSLQTSLPVMKLILLSPPLQNQRRPCDLSSHCYFECANGNAFFVFGVGEAEGRYSRSSANHSINYIFVWWTVVLGWNATIPVLPWRGGRVDAVALTE